MRGISPSRLRRANSRYDVVAASRVAELLEPQRVDRLAVADAQPGKGAMRVLAGRADLELGPRAEHRVLPHDPVRARPGLTVGHAVEPFAELGHASWNTSSALPSGTLPTSRTPPVARPLSVPAPVALVSVAMRVPPDVGQQRTSRRASGPLL